MKIEKVCRYVPVLTGLKSRGVTAGSTMRHMLISIPRVRWLENTDTDFYHKYKSPDEDPFIANPSYSPQWVETVKREPMTDRELLVERMLNDGSTQQQIADRLKIERGSVANIANRVRVKRAYQTLKADGESDV